MDDSKSLQEWFNESCHHVILSGLIQFTDKRIEHDKQRLIQLEKKKTELAQEHKKLSLQLKEIKATVEECEYIPQLNTFLRQHEKFSNSLKMAINNGNGNGNGDGNGNGNGNANGNVDVDVGAADSDGDTDMKSQNDDDTEHNQNNTASKPCLSQNDNSMLNEIPSTLKQLGCKYVLDNSADGDCVLQSSLAGLCIKNGDAMYDVQNARKQIANKLNTEMTSSDVDEATKTYLLNVLTVDNNNNNNNNNNTDDNNNNNNNNFIDDINELSLPGHWNSGKGDIMLHFLSTMDEPKFSDYQFIIYNVSPDIEECIFVKYAIDKQIGMNKKLVNGNITSMKEFLDNCIILGYIKCLNHYVLVVRGEEEGRVQSFIDQSNKNKQKNKQKQQQDHQWRLIKIEDYIKSIDEQMLTKAGKDTASLAMQQLIAKDDIIKSKRMQEIIATMITLIKLRHNDQTTKRLTHLKLLSEVMDTNAAIQNHDLLTWRAHYSSMQMLMRDENKLFQDLKSKVKTGNNQPFGDDDSIEQRMSKLSTNNYTTKKLLVELRLQNTNNRGKNNQIKRDHKKLLSIHYGCLKNIIDDLMAVCELNLNEITTLGDGKADRDLIGWRKEMIKFAFEQIKLINVADHNYVNKAKRWQDVIDSASVNQKAKK